MTILCDYMSGCLKDDAELREEETFQIYIFYIQLLNSPSKLYKFLANTWISCKVYRMLTLKKMPCMAISAICVSCSMRF